MLSLGACGSSTSAFVNLVEVQIILGHFVSSHALCPPPPQSVTPGFVHDCGARWYACDLGASGNADLTNCLNVFGRALSASFSVSREGRICGDGDYRRFTAVNKAKVVMLHHGSTVFSRSVSRSHSVLSSSVRFASHFRQKLVRGASNFAIELFCPHRGTRRRPLQYIYGNPLSEIPLISSLLCTRAV